MKSGTRRRFRGLNGTVDVFSKYILPRTLERGGGVSAHYGVRCPTKKRLQPHGVNALGHSCRECGSCTLEDLSGLSLWNHRFLEQRSASSRYISDDSHSEQASALDDFDGLWVPPVMFLRTHKGQKDGSSSSACHNRPDSYIQLQGPLQVPDKVVYVLNAC